MRIRRQHPVTADVGAVRQPRLEPIGDRRAVATGMEPTAGVNPPAVLVHDMQILRAAQAHRLVERDRHDARHSLQARSVTGTRAHHRGVRTGIGGEHQTQARQRTENDQQCRQPPSHDAPTAESARSTTRAFPSLADARPGRASPMGAARRRHRDHHLATPHRRMMLLPEPRLGRSRAHKPRQLQHGPDRVRQPRMREPVPPKLEAIDPHTAGPWPPTSAPQIQADKAH